MLAIVNPTAGGGRALRRWRQVAGLVRARQPDLHVVSDAGHDVVRAVIRCALAAGETEYVAAGGDGTVNLVASTLVELAQPRLDSLALGAIGLGSSNDFHKPQDARRGGLVTGVPVRLDFARAAPRDVCAVRCTDERGGTCTKYFIVNASVGVTAQANWQFNHPGFVLALLKRASTSAAITWAALSTIFLAAPLDVSLELDGEPQGRVRVQNLGIVKCPHFGGSLRYDSPFEPCSGTMYVHLIRARSVAQLLRLFVALSRGRFIGLPGTASWCARQVSLSAARPFAVECDGEVMRAVRAEFFVLPQRLRVCPA